MKFVKIGGQHVNLDNVSVVTPVNDKEKGFYFKMLLTDKKSPLTISGQNAKRIYNKLIKEITNEQSSESGKQSSKA